jgi:hypothetical protein
VLDAVVHGKLNKVHGTSVVVPPKKAGKVIGYEPTEGVGKVVCFADEIILWGQKDDRRQRRMSMLNWISFDMSLKGMFLPSRGKMPVDRCSQTRQDVNFVIKKRSQVTMIGHGIESWARTSAVRLFWWLVRWPDTGVADLARRDD